MTRKLERNRDAQCNTGNPLKLEIKFHFEHCSVDIFMLFCIVFHSFCIVKNVLHQFIILLPGEHLFCHFHRNCNYRLFPYCFTCMYHRSIFIHVYTCIIHVLYLINYTTGQEKPRSNCLGQVFCLLLDR